MNKLRIVIATFVIGLIFLPGIGLSAPSADKKSVKTFRILHIMSYHSPWRCADDKFSGFADGLKDLNIEYKTFQMDTKRKSDEEWKQKIGKKARDLINSWRPDMIYLTDDNAQKYVGSYYVNSSLPIVFSGVNADPANYGYIGSSNVAGVLEWEHFVETVKFFKQIVPGAKKVGVITDDDITWPPIIARMKEWAKQNFPDIEFTGWDDVTLTFADYQKKIKEYQNSMDAICTLGIFTFKDGNGKNVPLEEVSKWTIDNNKLPEITFYDDRIHKGNLCGVVVSEYELGRSAANLARGILIEGKKPSEYKFKPTIKGKPMINLKRANQLGIKIKSGVLLKAFVVNKYDWDQ